MKRLISTIVILIGINASLFAQYPGCPHIFVGNDTVIPCGASLDLNATVLETGETNTYLVSSVPYAPPFPYNGGTGVSVNTDDVWSSIINLPFTFCFYGQAKNQVIVGSNGLLSFDLTDAGGYCSWSFSSLVPSTLLQLDAIFGAYLDIDPSISGNVYYDITGSYPCRTFVFKFNQVALFSCSSSYCTQQIVLYESTNVIEVYIQSKPVCASWNSGNSVIGIQNSTGTTGLAPPGRNTGAWSATNEAWRFTPNGTPNYTINWYDIAGAFLGTGSTINVSPMGTSSYVGEVVYVNCNGDTVRVMDTISVTSPNPIVEIENDTICEGAQGSLLASGNYTYLWNTGSTTNPLTASPAITTTYSVTASDTYGCTSSAEAQIVVNENPQLQASSIDAHCGKSDGSVDVQVIGGSLPYNYQWNTVPASTQQSVGNIPSGTYNVTVIDDNGCQGTTTVNVSDIAGPTASFVADPSNADINVQINFNDFSIGATHWYWTFGDGADDNIQHTTHTYPFPGTYPVILYVQDDFSCRDSVSLNVVVNPLFYFYIPNSFSPNGDGINDIFKPEIIGLHPENGYKMQIFDRWGNQVFYTEDINEGWSGSIDGQDYIANKRQADVFVYYIYVKQVSGQDKEYIGNIIILK
jgi:gliding motility-associated-like protein